MGITLEEIKQAFASLPDERVPSSEDWELLATKWRESLNQRIAYMERVRDRLTGCIGCGCLSMKSCPMYNKDDQRENEEPGPVLLERN